jgi:hypothetical protein
LRAERRLRSGDGGRAFCLKPRHIRGLPFFILANELLLLRRVVTKSRFFHGETGDGAQLRDK